MTATADIQKSTAGTATTTTTTPDYRTGSTPSNPTSTVSDSIIGVHFHDIIRRHSKDIFGAILKVQCVNVRWPTSDYSRGVCSTVAASTNNSLALQAPCIDSLIINYLHLNSFILLIKCCWCLVEYNITNLLQDATLSQGQPRDAPYITSVLTQSCH